MSDTETPPAPAVVPLIDCPACAEDMPDDGRALCDACAEDTEHDDGRDDPAGGDDEDF